MRHETRRTERRNAIKQLEMRLERSTWGKGICLPGMVVPGARPAQIRAGARKLYDVMVGNLRKALRAEEKAARG